MSCVIRIIHEILDIILLIILVLRNHIIAWIRSFFFISFLTYCCPLSSWFVWRDTILSPHFAACLSFSRLKLLIFCLICLWLFILIYLIMNITILLKRWIIIIRLLSQRLLSPAFWINININYCTASLGCYMMLSAWLLGRNSLRIQSIQLNLKLVHWHWPRKLRYLIALNLIIVQ